MSFSVQHYHDHATRQLNQMLAPYAVSSLNATGRRYPESSCNTRSEFQRDRDRVIHSTAFRRLEYKTQVFVNHEGDLFRTRLTHSLEVAQIARSIARVLQLNEDLTEAIALAHDLGHTPFGHAGQDSLNRCMKNFGGFEHNLQSLRCVDELEEKYAQFDGLNLMFDTREGILKHCSIKNARQMGELGKRFVHRRQPSLEAQVTNLADEIAYNNHDIDDGLRAGLLQIDDLLEVTLYATFFNEVRRQYPDLSIKKRSYETIRRIINALVTDLIENSVNSIQTSNINSLDEVRNNTRPLIGFSQEIKQQCSELKLFLLKNLYQHEKVYRMSVKADRIITELFSVFMEDIKLLPEEHRKKAILNEQKMGAAGTALAVSDYIAGMTDRYAIAEHDRVFNLRLFH